MFLETVLLFGSTDTLATWYPTARFFWRTYVHVKTYAVLVSPHPDLPDALKPFANEILTFFGDPTPELLARLRLVYPTHMIHEKGAVLSSVLTTLPISFSFFHLPWVTMDNDRLLCYEHGTEYIAGSIQAWRTAFPVEKDLDTYLYSPKMDLPSNVIWRYDPTFARGVPIKGTRTELTDIAVSDLDPTINYIQEYPNVNDIFYSTHLNVIRDLVETRPIHAAFEVGLGLYSTTYLLTRCDRVVSMEMNDVAWYHKMQELLHCPRWRSFLSASVDPITSGYDLCLVDGGFRPESVLRAADCRIPIIVAHDTENPVHRWSILKLPDGPDRLAGYSVYVDRAHAPNTSVYFLDPWYPTIEPDPYTHGTLDLQGTLMPWYTAPVLSWLLRQPLVDWSVFEYGLGNSSVWFSKKCKRLVGVDHSTAWLSYVRTKCPTGVFYHAGVPDVIDGMESEANDYIQTLKEPFDLVVVDGVYRAACFRAATRWSKKWIIYDNYHQASVGITSEPVAKGWDRYIFPDLVHPDWSTALFRKK